MKRLLGLLFVTLTGCATGFQRSVTVTLKAASDARKIVFEAADVTAQKNRLELDERGSSEDKRGYFGTPYHYYRVEVQETTGIVTAEYVHEARRANTKRPNTGPEDDFLEELKKKEGIQIIEVKKVPR
jgi:hypothetical protein